jgi:cytochrome b561
VLFLWTALLGWGAALLIAIGVAIPYVVRATPSAAAPHLRRLRPHFAIGLFIPALALAHAWLQMTVPLRGYDQLGLLLATIAFFALIQQVAQGLALRLTRGPSRTSARRVHFWTMAAIAALVAGHVALNYA